MTAASASGHCAVRVKTLAASAEGERGRQDAPEAQAEPQLERRRQDEVQSRSQALCLVGEGP